MTPRNRTLAATTAIIALTATACGDSSSSQEAALERLIENESGQEIDLDLDGDGGFSLQSEDGGFSINVDDDGNVVFDSDEGSGTFDIDGDTGGTLEFEGDDGSGSVQVGEDGSFVVTDEDGEVVTGQADGDGGFTVTGEDGETMVTDIDEDSGSVVISSDDGSTFESGPGIPDQWPSDIPQPVGLSDATGTFMGDATSMNVVVAGTPEGDPIAYLDDYVAQLVAAGFSETATYTSDQAVTYTHERDGIMVASSYSDLGVTGQIVVTIGQS
ncbi:hypothetical protein [Ilumatobacter coccineus]|jgi:hypothetical protein|uniref:Uncharacterized protein n=1 Tax=Ilumatobacter coccineus (strain NBRC 103263 / KCTC 29153 / YM16-304) TaxID=1313172 RepID=A0A6C7EHM7_ILUCY|nr:hypothetical protein [Ilumatobacter coccineus]BAN04475.1 hypothetical protein YM304_41610 [Ilumatobacter coccineus YM16-304]